MKFRNQAPREEPRAPATITTDKMGQSLETEKMCSPWPLCENMFHSQTKMDQKPATLRIDLIAPLLILSKMNATITGGPPVDARPNMKPLTK